MDGADAAPPPPPTRDENGCVVLTQVNDTFSLLDLTPIGTLFNDAREAEKESGALAESSRSLGG